jgi:2-polyprenyl-3-methyl-5-hydroxy-6-metoxy-1,4-benzoquinol methylase
MTKSLNLRDAREVEKRVASQYERYPYPPCNDINQIRIITAAHLERLNHHCFAGRQSFETFNVLDAGCGTGDALLSLAKQFSNMEGNQHVVGIDLSAASLKIAQERLHYHGVSQYVTLRQASILDFPKICKRKFPKFDYIICNGVLHHMESPSEGLRALAECLDPEGCMYIMLYAKYGRLGIDLLQQFLKTLTADMAKRHKMIEVARKVLDMLPDSSLFKLQPFPSDIAMGDAGIYDVLLHSKNQMMALPEVFKITREAGLHFNKFTDHAWQYEPINTFTEPILSRILALPQEKQFEMCELFRTSISNHCFYVTAKAPLSVCASISELENVPLLHPDMEWLRKILLSAPRGADKVNIKHAEMQLEFNINSSITKFVELIDGKRTLKGIFEESCRMLKTSRRQFSREIDKFADLMIRRYILLLCHKDALIRYKDLSEQGNVVWARNSDCL